MWLPIAIITSLLIVLAMVAFYSGMQPGVEGGTWTSGILGVFKTIYKPVA